MIRSFDTMKRNYLLHLLATAIVSTIVGHVGAQQPDCQLTPGQQHIQELSSMVGEWELTEKDGRISTRTIRWINNKSFIELVHEDYREITRWDLVEKRFVTQAFGGIGGHAKYVWTKKEGGAWSLVADPAYYVASGEAVPWQATIEQIDRDTMTFKVTFGDHQMENIARRKKHEAISNVSRQ
jgi:hypothetical protein